MIQPVQVALIRTDGGTQPRAGITMAVVEEYVEALAGGAQFPPVQVVYDGQSYWLYDGFHRVEAHRLAHEELIEANVLQGTVEDARWYSCQANSTHGLQRTSADKRRAIATALKHPRSEKMSDRAIAEHCGVSDKTVATVRAELVATAEIPQLETRVGQDGKARRLPEKPAPPDAGDDLLGPDEFALPSDLGFYEFPQEESVDLRTAKGDAFVKVWVLQVATREWIWAHSVKYCEGGSMTPLGRMDGVLPTEHQAVCRGVAGAIRALMDAQPSGIRAKNQVMVLMGKAGEFLQDMVAAPTMHDALRVAWPAEFGPSSEAEKPEVTYPQPNELGDYLPWDAYGWEEFRPSDPRLVDCWIRSLQVGVERYAVGWAVRIGKRAHVENASEGNLAQFGEQEGARAIVLWVEDVYDSLDEAGKAAARALLRWTLAEFNQWSEQIDERDPEPAADQDPERPKLEVLPPSATQVRMVASAFRLLATSNYDWLDLIVKVRAEVGADVIEAARKNVEFCAKACRAPRVG